MSPKLLRVLVPIGLIVGVLAVVGGSIVYRTVVGPLETEVAGALPMTGSSDISAAAFFETPEGPVALVQDSFLVDAERRQRLTTVDLAAGRVLARVPFVPPGVTALTGQELRYLGQSEAGAWFHGTGMGVHARAPRTGEVTLEGHAAEADKPPDLATDGARRAVAATTRATLSDGTQVSIAAKRVSIQAPGARSGARYDLEHPGHVVVDGVTGQAIELSDPPGVLVLHRTTSEGTLEVSRLSLDGEVRWTTRSQHRVDESADGRGPNVVGAHVVDGAVVFVFGGLLRGEPTRRACHLIALELAEGRIRWKLTL